ncbi:MAG TPA: DUF2269 family protein [Thermoanaerobaculia bacterium]|nr:DUF2269 family protein [Thermoanaerobaculia bacterium]
MSARRAAAPLTDDEEAAMGPFYPWFLFLHVTGAFWLAAGVFASAVVRAQARRATGAAERALATALLWRLHVIYTLPGLLVAGFVGFYLVSAGGFRFGDTWVLAAAFLYLLMFLSTLFVVTPGLSRQRAAARAAAAADAGAAAGTPLPKLPGIFSDINALLILVLACLMVVKP